MIKQLIIALSLIGLSACSQAENPSNPLPKTQSNKPIAQGNTMQLLIGQHAFAVNLDDNPAAQELRNLLPLTLTMDDLHHNEKYATLPKKLSQNDTAVQRIEAGDVLLWQGDTIVVFYESFATPYSYTRLGKISDNSALKTALDKGSVTVSFGL